MARAKGIAGLLHRITAIKTIAANIWNDISDTGQAPSMKIVDSQGKEISNLEQWRSGVFDGTSKTRHWKKGRSAYSLAKFIMTRNGAAYLEERISSVLSRQATLEQATPEFPARFDSYPGNPSNLDLGITGRLGRSAHQQTLFVGLEAKVDETFGSTVGSRYSSAMKKRRAGQNTNAPERVRDLLSKHFSVEDTADSSRFADVRYQLLTGTAGTVAAPGEVFVFYILILRTSEYDVRKGLANQVDYERFIEAARGKLLMRHGEDFRADELMSAGKRLVCIHEYVDL